MTPKASAPFPLPQPWIEHAFRVFAEPLQHWKETNQIPHALLLTGMKGVGKKQLAYLIAQWANCEKSGFAMTEEPGLFGESALPSKALTPPCGSCGSCNTLIHGNSVDVLELKPEDSESESIKIDALRDLKNSARFGSFNSPFRFVIAPDAERLTTQATNSVLKLLEEPPEKWIFILSVTDRSLILPTIASRCQTLRVVPMDEIQCAELIEQIAKVPTQQAQTQARLALGCLFRALHEMNDESFATAREQVREFIKDPAKAYLTTIDWAAQSPKEHSALIELLEYDLHRRLKLDPSSKRDLELATIVQSHREKISLPLNRKLTVQSLLAHWLPHAQR